MDSSYLLPTRTAAALFPLCAVLLLLPTAIVLYRRHGVVTPWRTLSVFGFGYYALTALCMTAVPLPRRGPGMCERYAAVADPQLLPGNTFGDVWREARHRITLDDLVLHNPAVSGTLWNLLLLLPLGVFLRYHSRHGLPATAATGLGVSLFFEVTQLTGLWGVYPCPYRLFDVDDLTVNAAGAALGWWAAGPLVRALPALETLDERALARRPVPFGRRLVALTADLTGWLLATVAAQTVMRFPALPDPSGMPRVALGVFVVWFVLLPCLTGATPGKRLMRLRLVPSGRGPGLDPWRLAVRAAVVGAVVWPLLAAAFWALSVVLYEPSPVELAGAARQAGGPEVLAMVALNASGALGPVLSTGVLAAYALLTLRHQEGPALHERISGIRNEALPHTRARTPAPARG